MERGGIDRYIERWRYREKETERVSVRGRGVKPYY